MNNADTRRAKALAISHGLILGGISTVVALNLIFLVSLALDVRNSAGVLLVPAVVAVTINAASIVYMYKRRSV